MIERISDFLKMNDVEYKENANLSDISTIRIGNKAAFAIKPGTDNDMIRILRFLEENNINYKTVGKMSNILPSDEYWNGVIIRTDLLKKYQISDGVLCAECGVSLPGIAYALAEKAMSGFEELSGIPGSIGGAVVGNAGAFGKEISDVLKDVTVYDIKRDKTITLTNEDLDFGYRHSRLQAGDLIVLKARFALSGDSQERIKARMLEYKRLRLEKQPKEPSLGSVFKRPQKGYAARMIDACGLKGYSIGGAQISQKHAGFIVNNGGATSADVKRLVDIAQKQVRNKFKILLEREIEYL